MHKVPCHWQSVFRIGTSVTRFLNTDCNLSILCPSRRDHTAAVSWSVSINPTGEHEGEPLCQNSFQVLIIKLQAAEFDSLFSASWVQVLLDGNASTDFGLSISSCDGDDSESKCIKANITGGELDVDVKYVSFLKAYVSCDCAGWLENIAYPLFILHASFEKGECEKWSTCRWWWQYLSICILKEPMRDGSIYLEKVQVGRICTIKTGARNLRT